jgi:phosphate transport system substrate-binding protein
VIAGIYLGKITNWNDPRSRRSTRASPARQGDHAVYRSDSSGTSYNFTSYLNTVSQQWKSQVGSGTTVNWPSGVGARGSSGVSGVVSRTEGAIGYADIAYALKNHLKFVSDSEQVEAVRRGPGSRHQGGVARGPQVQPDERALDRQPAAGQDVREGVSDLHVHVRDPADELAAGGAAEAVHHVGADDGPAVRAALIFQPIPKYVVTNRARRPSRRFTPRVRIARMAVAQNA